MTRTGRPPSNSPGSRGAQLLLAAIEAAGETRASAARRLGLTAPRLSRLLSGHRAPMLDVVVEIERAYGVPPRAWVDAIIG